ncbi:MAG TPA: M28 family metallopeptidase [Terriglobia bacterium]|nr:M28 family metallopeptidase [Terriglobia bacterium]
MIKPLFEHAALLAAAILPAVLAVFASGAAPGSTPAAEQSAWKSISASGLLEDIKTLSSDEFEGRAPASRGEQLTVDYLVSRFKQIGLAPGNPDGTYLQNVPLVGIKANPDTELVLSKEGAAPDTGMGKSSVMHLRYGPDFMAWTKRVEPEVSLAAPLVFVGYGVVAPEYHWDDYKGVDVRGKVLVMLINDPQIPDPKDPSQLDPNMFKGRAMTYYGRWTYKFEIAAAKGAAGALIIHETGPAGYPWAVVQGSNTGEQFSLLSADQGHSRCAVEGWITTEKAKALFASAGLDFDALHKAALTRSFTPVPLGMEASLKLTNTIRDIESHNVIGKLEGSDPKLRNQYVIYTAHWDHLGIGPEVNGDNIYHGAVDNASGVSGVLEIARAFAEVQPKPRRSILFLSVTAEEKGLLGSQYYAEHPLYPLKDTLAEINMDGINVHGLTRDVTVIGLGNSQLDDYLRQAASEQGRSLRPDPEPEKGFYFRSDHFNFAKQGVPALDPDSGIDYIGRPEGWGLKMLDEYTANDYHKPSDKIKPDWDFAGAVQDLQLLFSVGYRVASADKFPEWSADSEFRAKREAMLEGGR